MIHYTIEPDNSYLLIKIELKESGPKRVLYRDTLLQIAKGKDLDAVKFLIQEEMKISNNRSDSAPFNQVRVPFKRSSDALKLLGATGNLFFKGKKLFVDPFTRLKLSFEVDEMVKGVVHVGSKSFDLASCDAVFPGDLAWIIRDNTVQLFAEDTEWRLLQLLYPLPKPLTKKVAEELEDCKDVVWKKKPEELPAVEPLPFLILKDRSGAFADLWFDYGDEGKVAGHDVRHVPWRQSGLERGWERDLLETDFIKKIVGSSHYYCPLDKVSKSLTFLLEIGWKIFDHRGKEVVRQSSNTLELVSGKDGLLVKGKVAYADHQADLTTVLGAFNRRERFVELAPGKVGLLDPQPYWTDLSEEECVSEGVRLKKHRVGLLDDLFSKKVVADTLGEPSFDPPTEAFQGVLHPYQQEGVDWLSFLRANSFHGLLADEMGLGKTVQAIAFLSKLPLAAPILVVAPTSLLFNWRRELEKFLPSHSVYVHEGAERAVSKEALTTHHIILTSYALLRLDMGLLEQIFYECVLLDEAQMIKNPESQVARCAFRLESKTRIAITGTPIENRSSDLWSLFHFLIPELLGEQKEFEARLTASQSDGRHLKSVRKLLRPFILRRTKEAVLEQLPPKIEQTLWIEMEEEQKTFYEEWLAKARSGLMKKVALDGAASHRMEILETILRLRQICCHPLLLGSNAQSAKFERLMSDLEEVALEGHKVLVYSQFTTMLQLIAKEVQVRGWQFAYLDGSTKDREKVVESFQTDKNVKIFLISLKAGGVGLNLTAADYVFLFDPWWNVAAEEQAIDRAHRMGREGAVIAKRYVTALSIEEKMMKLKEHKQFLSKGVLDFEELLNNLSFDDIIKHLI